MLLSKPHNFFPSHVVLTIALICLTNMAFGGVAQEVLVRLKNGDRITGRLLAQETNHIIISTGWAESLVLPISTIGGLETGLDEKQVNLGQTISHQKQRIPELKPKPTQAAAPVAIVKAAPTAKPPRSIQGNLQLGSHLQFGSRDQRTIFGRIGTIYTRPYTSDPKKSLHVITSYSYDYSEIENVKSVDRMVASLKTDFDLNSSTYGYNIVGAGYDKIRKIDEHYEIGPGLGWHAIKKSAFSLDFEAGADYQIQNRSVGGDIDSLFLRLSESFTWVIAPRITVSETLASYLNGEKTDQLRIRFDSSIKYKLFDNLFLNITLTDLYDSNPAPLVDRNEFQVISSIGVTF